MGVCSARRKTKISKCRFCNAPADDGHLFLGMPLSSICETAQQPEFSSLLKRDRTQWLGACSGMAGLPGLSPRRVGSPSAVAASDLACNNLEKGTGTLLRLHPPWTLLWDQEDA